MRPKTSDRFGRRTISAVPKNDSMVLIYDLVHETDPSGGGLGLTKPAHNVTPITVEQHTLEVPAASFQNGHHLVVWFTAQDVVGNTETKRLTVGLDQSAPENVTDEFKTKTIDEFVSRLNIIWGPNNCNFSLKIV